jgi:two-component system, cell cycle sensor histidine kinase PleC
MLAVATALYRRAYQREASHRRRCERAILDVGIRVRSEFLQNMSHELRTPLNAIIGFANILVKNRNKTLGEQELVYASRITDNGTRLLRLVEDLLHLSDLEAGLIEVALQPVGVHDLLANVGELVAPLARAEGVELQVQSTNAWVMVFANEKCARQILLDLVINALTFTPEGGTVVVACVVRDGWAHIEVRDSGTGMRPDELIALFEPVTSVEHTRGQPFGDVGRRVTISRALARRMGGELEAVSTVGQGSTFTLHLPLARTRGG